MLAALVTEALLRRHMLSVQPLKLRVIYTQVLP